MRNLGTPQNNGVPWTDPEPLVGTNHRTLGLYVWDGTIVVSDIKVEALK